MINKEVKNMTDITRDNHIFRIKLTKENKDKIPIISRKAIEEAKRVLLKYNVK